MVELKIHLSWTSLSLQETSGWNDSGLQAAVTVQTMRVSQTEPHKIYNLRVSFIGTKNLYLSLAHSVLVS